MTRKIYEVVNESLPLRSTPNSGKDNVIQAFHHGLLVERLSKGTFDDENLGSGIVFITVKVSDEVEGYMALYREAVDDSTEENSEDDIVEHYLLRTISARVAQKVLH